MSPHKLFTDVKPTISHLYTFCCKVWIRVSNKKRKHFEGKAPPKIFLHSISYGMYRFVMESDRTIHVSRHCVVKEDTFL